ncbi:hypothetical protein EP331_07420 [bacterium]|nr:MAG: hypothetical protein EP331_07420 [bacterium]
MNPVLLVGAGQTLLPSIVQASFWIQQGVRVQWLCEQTQVYSTQMIKEYLAGVYSLDEISISVEELASEYGIELIRDKVALVLPKENRVIGESGKIYSYSCIVLDDESSHSDEDSVGVIPENLVNLKNAFTNSAQVQIVGGGIKGVELALNLSVSTEIQLTVSEKEKRLLPLYSKQASDCVHKMLIERGVLIQLGRHVYKTKESVTCIDATESKGSEYLKKSGLAVDVNGFLVVNSKLLSISSFNVFAVGKSSKVQGCESVKPNKAFMLKQGKILRDNIEAWLFKQKMIQHGRKELHTFSFVDLGGILISTGSENGLYFNRYVAIYHPLILRLKRESDLRWIQRYQRKEHFKSFFERFHH